MPTPDPAENGAPEPRPEPDPEPDPGSPPDEPGQHAQPWTWSVDPDPPIREPTADPAADPTVDEPLPPPPVATPTHGTESPARPPDWSTPETPVVAPPIGGDPSAPYPDQPAPDPDLSAPYPQQPAPYWPDQAPPGPDQPTSWLDEPPAYPGTPSPERGRRLWLLLGVSVALVLCCCAGVVGTALTWGSDLYAEMDNRGQRIVGLNQVGRDGDLEFLVHEVKCGVGRVGDPLINRAAVGQFCVVELAVRNVGQRPAFFTDTLQRAYGPDGEQFGADSGASILANSDQQAFLGEINPGIQVTGAVVYDIPSHARIVRLRLHHHPTSPGLVVRVQ
jgi:hypothetical protein